MATLYFIRHGETDWNAEGRLQGQRDIPMNALGRRQAAAAALTLGKEALAAREPGSLAWWASPLGRTLETMAIVRETLELPPDGFQTDDRMRELSFGRWEGLTWREVRRADPAGAAGRERDKWNAVPPDGESYEMLLERVSPFVSGLTADSLLVSHGGVARALMVLLGGTSRMDAPLIDIWQGKVLRFESGGWAWL